MLSAVVFLHKNGTREQTTLNTVWLKLDLDLSCRLSCNHLP